MKWVRAFLIFVAISTPPTAETTQLSVKEISGLSGNPELSSPNGRISISTSTTEIVISGNVASTTIQDTADLDLTITATGTVSATAKAWTTGDATKAVGSTSIMLATERVREDHLKITGGSDGQFLKKLSSTDGGFEWGTPGGGTSTTTYYLHYSARFPSPSSPGEDDPSTNAVLLSATSTTGIDFANEKIPQFWDGTSDLVPQLAVSTQATPAAASFTIQLHGQIIKPGSQCWGTDRYTIFGTATFLLASTTAMQFFQKSSFRIPAASATRGSYVHYRFYRVPTFSGDTYGKQIYFDSMAVKLVTE